MGAVVALGLAFGFLVYSGVLAISIQELAEWLGASILILSGAFFVYLFVAGGLSGTEKRHLAVIIWLYLLAAVFWSGFEQAGSSLNLFARDLTNRTVAGWEMPASWLQNVNPILIIIFAPIFGWLWTWLAGAQRQSIVAAEICAGAVRPGGRIFRDFVGRGERQRGQPRVDVAG